MAMAFTRKGREGNNLRNGITAETEPELLQQHIELIEGNELKKEDESTAKGNNRGYILWDTCRATHSAYTL
jgi:hypothetical protein